MGRFYCDYCHCYLTHDSASVRKAHNVGRNHLQLVRDYYSNLGFDKTQSVIDSLTQDYQSRVIEPNNPFAQGAGASALGGRPGFTSFTGISFGGGPRPGMPLQPPPGMPLPGGGFAPGGPGTVVPPPFGLFPPVAGVNPPPAGGKVEGTGS